MADLSFQINCRSGSQKGRTFTVADKLTVGRDDSCQLVIDDPKVSRHHGTFMVRDGRFFFEDKRSTNGSFLNGNRILECELHYGDVLKVGGAEFAVVQESDFNTINFVNSDSMVTSVVNTGFFKADALADKFSQIFEYYRENQPESSEVEQIEIVKTQRLLNGLRSIYSMSQEMTKLAPLAELLECIATSIFDLFAGAENLVILLWDEEKKRLVPRHVRNRSGSEDLAVSVSGTVLDRAVRERSTLIANDASADDRLSNAESIIGFAVKAVMCAPLVSGERVIGALYLDNRLLNVTYDDLDAEILSAFANQCAVSVENAKLCDSLQENYHQTLQSLINAIEAKDSYTMGHTARVSRHSVGIGRALGFDEPRLERLQLAADLHDIGKIGIKEGIINKSGKLTDTEYLTIKDHVEIGEKILRPITYLADVLPFIRGHHEKWDGTGYPDGLKGEQCPLEGRVIALADAFDAMTSQRSYNKPLTYEEAAERVRQSAGTHFDPQVVKAFEEYLKRELLAPGGGLGQPDPVTQGGKTPTPNYLAAQGR